MPRFEAAKFTEDCLPAARDSAVELKKHVRKAGGYTHVRDDETGK